jgi:Tfp pilus assembly protein PilO
MMTGKRAPIIAGIAVMVVAFMAFLLLVNPKRAEVAGAQKDLEDARAEQISLQTELGSLKDAEAAAPANRKIIRQVEQQLPPTADPQGLILLLSHAADQSGCDVSTTSVGTPALDPVKGFSTIGISLTVSGGYFALDEFLYQIETLPRAAKVLSISMSPNAAAASTTTTTTTTTTSGSLAMQVSMELYTTDQSAGPGSDPGPTSGVTSDVIATGTG